MGFQSGINATLGSVAGAGLAIQKTLQQRQENANKKAKEKQEAQQVQKEKFKKSIILDATGNNLLVPMKETIGGK